MSEAWRWWETYRVWKAKGIPATLSLANGESVQVKADIALRRKFKTRPWECWCRPNDIGPVSAILDDRVSLEVGGRKWRGQVVDVRVEHNRLLCVDDATVIVRMSGAAPTTVVSLLP